MCFLVLILLSLQTIHRPLQATIICLAPLVSSYHRGKSESMCCKLPMQLSSEGFSDTPAILHWSCALATWPRGDAFGQMVSLKYHRMSSCSSHICMLSCPLELGLNLKRRQPAVVGLPVCFTTNTAWGIKHFPCCDWLCSSSLFCSVFNLHVLSRFASVVFAALFCRRWSRICFLCLAGFVICLFVCLFLPLPSFCTSFKTTIVFKNLHYFHTCNCFLANQGALSSWLGFGLGRSPYTCYQVAGPVDIPLSNNFWLVRQRQPVQRLAHWIIFANFFSISQIMNWKCIPTYCFSFNIEYVGQKT